MREALRRTFFAFALLSIGASAGAGQASVRSHKLVTTYSVQAGGADLQIDFEAGEFDLPRKEFVDRLQKSALTVALYYGRFPVPRARILIIPVAGEDGILQGTTWGGVGGWPGFTRLRIGQHTRHAELQSDWVIPHELTHMALASLPDDQYWLEEGIATYVEPIARAQTGELTAEQVWSGMVAGMPNGEPGADDHGMDHTHTWGRTYWGGALFCLVADIEIHKQTNDGMGLQDALRAIVAAGGTIDQERPVEELLRVGDRATKTHVLEEMYAQWSQKPVAVDLDRLWSQLGIVPSADSSKGNIHFNSVAPLSRIRVRLTTLHETAVLPLAKTRAAVSNSASRP